MKIAIQLYTLRDVNITFPEVLKKVKSFGYDGVEFAGFHDMSAYVLKSLLDELHLEALASHTSFKLLSEQIDQVITYNKILGNKNIVIPYTEIKDLKSYDFILPKLKLITNHLNQEGFNVYYHNHVDEFNKVGGEYLLDKILNDIPQMRLELDVYWAIYAGVNAVEYLKKHASRIDFIHAKDMEIIDEQKSFTSVGDGIIDYQEILDLPLDYQYWIVENDKPKDDPFMNIQRSINHIKTLVKGEK